MGTGGGVVSHGRPAYNARWRESLFMHGYNGKDLARSFRTVRANTIKIAEEIPEDKYGYRVAEGTRSVAETLAHLATGTGWATEMHGQRLLAVEFALLWAPCS